jgi:hypothetical protein
MYLIAWLGVTNQTGNYYKYFQVKEPFEYYYYFKGKGGGGRGEYRTFDPQKEGYAILNASVAMTVPLVLLIILVPVAALQGRRNVKRERERLKSLGIISAGYPEALGLETRHLALDVLIVYKDKMPDSDTMRLAARGLYRKSIHKREHRSDRFELPVYSEKYEIYITRMYKVYRFVHRMVTTINAEYPIERISVTKKE